MVLKTHAQFPVGENPLLRQLIQRVQIVSGQGALHLVAEAAELLDVALHHLGVQGPFSIVQRFDRHAAIIVIGYWQQSKRW